MITLLGTISFTILRSQRDLRCRRSPALWLWVGMLGILNLSAHPGWGIVVDDRDQVYFTDVQHTAIWRWSVAEGLQVEQKDTWAHSLGLRSDGGLYFGKEEYRGNVGPYQSFWTVSPTGALTARVTPYLSREDSMAANAVLASNGDLLYLSQEGVRRRTQAGRDTLWVPLATGAMTALAIRDDRLFLTVEDTILTVSPEGEVTERANELLVEEPQDPIFSDGGFNNLLGLTVTPSQEILVAYFGDRSVIRIGARGRKETVYRSQNPWSPVGVAVRNEAVYVLESGWREGSGLIGTRVLKGRVGGEFKLLVEVNEAVAASKLP